MILNQVYENVRCFCARHEGTWITASTATHILNPHTKQRPALRADHFAVSETARSAHYTEVWVDRETAWTPQRRKTHVAPAEYGT
jgi:hypothetical protein